VLTVRILLVMLKRFVSRALARGPRTLHAFLKRTEAQATNDSAYTPDSGSMGGSRWLLST
jgi:hypothetical protein